MKADPRLLARFDGKTSQWKIADGVHRVALGKSAADLMLSDEVQLAARAFGD